MSSETTKDKNPLPSRATRARTYRLVGWWGRLQLMAAIVLALMITGTSIYLDGDVGLVLAMWGPIFVDSAFEAWSCTAFLRRWRAGSTLLRITCVLNITKCAVVPTAILATMIFARYASPTNLGVLGLIALVCAGIAYYWVRLYRFTRVVEKIPSAPAP